MTAIVPVTKRNNQISIFHYIGDKMTGFVRGMDFCFQLLPLSTKAMLPYSCVCVRACVSVGGVGVDWERLI